jgi:hypothetical protein
MKGTGKRISKFLIRKHKKIIENGIHPSKMQEMNKRKSKMLTVEPTALSMMKCAI